MVEGVTKGFEKRLEIQGVGYRAGLRGSDLELDRRLLAFGRRLAAAGDHVRRAGAERGRRSRASTSSSSARRRQRCARCGRPSRTRARASATRVSMSAGRWASAHEPLDARGARAPPPARTRRRSPALPSGRAWPCSARTSASMRSSIDDVGGRTLAAASWHEPAEELQGHEDRAGQRGRQASRRSGQEGRQSRHACSTAPGICTTDA